MDDTKCGDCGHWDQPKKGSIHGLCFRVPHDENRHTDDLCYTPKYKLDEAKAMRDNNPAVIRDSLGSAAALMTREDFGCVLFTRKGEVA